MASSQPDFLDEDPVTVHGQTYALISFVSPSARTAQKSAHFGLKIRGCFNSTEEAEAHVKKLQRLDPAFDIFLVDMYKWLAVPPDPEAIQDQRYQEDFLQNLICEYKKSQMLARQHFEERKRAVMEEGLDKHLLPDERVGGGGDDDAGPSSSS